MSPIESNDVRGFYGHVHDVKFFTLEDQTDLTQQNVRRLWNIDIDREVPEITVSPRQSPSATENRAEDEETTDAVSTSEPMSLPARGRGPDSVGLALIVVGVILVCLALAALLVALRKRRAKNNTAQEMSSARSDIDDPVYGSLQTSFSNLD